MLKKFFAMFTKSTTMESEMVERQLAAQREQAAQDAVIERNRAKKAAEDMKLTEQQVGLEVEPVEEKESVDEEKAA